MNTTTMQTERDTYAEKITAALAFLDQHGDRHDTAAQLERVCVHAAYVAALDEALAAGTPSADRAARLDLARDALARHEAARTAVARTGAVPNLARARAYIAAARVA